MVAQFSLDKLRLPMHFLPQFPPVNFPSNSGKSPNQEAVYTSLCAGKLKMLAAKGSESAKVYLEDTKDGWLGTAQF